MIDPTEFITVREAAKLTDYTAEYVRRLARENRITHQKVGPIVLVSKTDLLRHKEEQDARREGYAAKKPDSPAE